MYLTKYFLGFLIIFFSLQLLFGEAGVLTFIQIRKNTDLFLENVNSLLNINQKLNRQIELTKNNQSYLLMNAHRVGLLAKDEYLIKTDISLLDKSNIYSPGKIILYKKIFYFSNLVLFLCSLFFVMCAFSMNMIVNYVSIKTTGENSSFDEDIANSIVLNELQENHARDSQLIFNSEENNNKMYR